MARTRKTLAARVDVAHLISAGVLASVCPRELIEEVLAQTDKASQRERLLPAPAVVYYVMALALWREAPLEEVLRVVCEGLQWLSGGKAGAVQASKSAISQARTRLGPQAAWSHALDPDRLSFVHAVRVIKRKMPQAAAIPP